MIRFGIFEVNLAAGELRKNGTRIKLQEQPFKLLAALLERPGEVVTREELKEKLWAGDTFVDFDHGLSTAVNKIREALGDSASSPRFVETVPRRGYRFITDARSDGSTSAPAQPRATRNAITNRIAIVCLLGLVLAAAWFVSRDSDGEQSRIPLVWSEPRRITSDSGLTFQPAISPDGTLIAYSSDRAGEGNLDIWVQQTAGGEPHRITDDPADETAPQFSPDGRSIAFRSERGEGGIYIAPTLGGFERSVAARGHWPKFSPDGRWIAYVTGPRGLSSAVSRVPAGQAYVVPASGGMPQKLATDRPSMGPVWSPDGSALLLWTAQRVFDNRSFEWRLVTLDGVDRGPTGALAVILDSLKPLDFLYPDHWDSDGFVYFSSRDADSAGLWRIRVNADSAKVAGEPEKVLSGTGLYRGASIANDGKLVFASLTENPDIWSLPIDPDGDVAKARETVRLTMASGADTHPSASPDGSRVVFQSNRSGKNEVWLLDAVTGNERPLMEIRFPARAVLNAEGNRIAVGGPDGQSILSVDGIVEKQFPGNSYTWDWSPDDAFVLFSRLDERQLPIYLLDVDSGETTKLLSAPQQGSFQSQFSPDGRWIAWQTGPAGTAWIARFQGPQPIPESEWIKVSEDGWFADKPRWSPNGNTLYYTSDRDGFTCIYAQPLDPRTKQPSGDLLEIYHSHGTRLAIANLGGPGLEIDVARDKIVFGMAELTGNIWMMEPLSEN